MQTAEQAEKYLEEHKVLELFSELSAALIHNQPEDPKAFLLEHLERLQKLKEAGSDSKFFEKSDLEGMFSLFDPTGRGTLARSQLVTAFRTLGLKEEPPIESEVIDKDTFVEVIQKQLAKEKAL